MRANPLGLVLLATFPAAAHAQQQLREKGIKLLPPLGGAAGTGDAHAAADVDGDGDQDLLIALGRTFLQLNDGRGNFRDVTATHMPAAAWSTSALAVGDLDADGDLDLVLANRQEPSRLYLNDGSGRFSDGTAGRLPSGIDGSTAVVSGDVDGDHDLDLVFGNYGRQNTLYLNDGTGAFADATAANMPARAEATRACAIGDVDGDSDLDLVFGTAIGWSAYFNENELYVNDGSGRFTNATNGFPYTGRRTYDVVLNDLDRDGDLDMVWASQTESRTFTNDGAGRFTAAAPLPASAAVSAGDVDGDGHVDLVLASQVFRNDTRGGFLPTEGLPVAALPNSGPARAELRAGTLQDFDGDGDLDVVAQDRRNRLYLNDGAGFFGRAVLPRAAAATPAAVAAADVDRDGDEDLVLGNDGGFGTVGREIKLLLNDGAGAFEDASAARLPAASPTTRATRAVAFGDLDGDGDIDLVLGRWRQPNQLFFNDGGGYFADASAGRINPIADPTNDAALGDVDGDGDLDLVIANGVVLNDNAQNRLYLNDGSGSFADATSTRMPPDADDTTAVAMADVDGDGDRDLVFANHGEQARLYLNDGSGGFADATSRLPTRITTARDAAAADVDGDGDLDLVIANGAEPASLYLNDGGGSFADVTATHLPVNAPPSHAEDVVVGDVDGDGDVDLALAFSAEAAAGYWPSPDQNRLYRNDGRGRFEDATAAAMPVRLDRTTCVALHDLDGDGDLDLVAGNQGTAEQSHVYFNDLRQIDAIAVPALGRTYELDLFAKYGSGNPPVTVFPLLAAAGAVIPLPPFGTLRLLPAQMVPLPAVVIPQPGERRMLSLPIPSLPALVGVELLFQAAFVRGADVRLSNLSADRIR